MKQVGFAAFIAFWSSVGTLLMLFWLVPATPSDAKEEAEEKTGYTMAEVARHNTTEDCWMVIESQVYDFSNYIPKHPAPAVVMANWCGKEATQGMKTKGYGNNHSQTAWEMMAGYQIGILKEE